MRGRDGLTGDEIAKAVAAQHREDRRRERNRERMRRAREAEKSPGGVTPSHGAHTRPRRAVRHSDPTAPTRRARARKRRQRARKRRAELMRVASVQDLVNALAAHRLAQGLTQLDVDEIAGFAGGHTGKLELGPAKRGGRGLGETTLPLWLAALGVELLVVPRGARICLEGARS